MGSRAKMDQIDSEILDAMGELIATLIGRGEQIARHFGVPAFCLKALHVLNPSMAMRDLGKYMHCDPSFVTSIADLLEKRGLARREASLADRRVKNLVLTDEGVGLRDKMELEFMAAMPWNEALDNDERTCLLALIRKMTMAADGSASTTTPPATGGTEAGEVTETLTSAQPGS
ncbi:MAG TPA: MarR family transcriptional regulator [Streptosporangiaceae bacterium]|jgi:DNA-binding MarR family transcriptional regulator|nr:MarR family transcriptional regulator [Streptosporangiaceae bacterium]